MAAKCFLIVSLVAIASVTAQIIPESHKNNHAAKIHHNSTQKNHPTKHDLLSSLLSQYDKTVLPSAHAGNDGLPTAVTVNLLIRDGSLNDEHQEFHTTVTLRLNWTDSRLQYQGSSKHPYLPVHDGHKLWTPDIFFKDEKSAHFHHVLTPNVLYRIYPDGTVSMSTRLSLVLGCQMDFTWFPFDHQTCRINLASYAHTTSEVMLLWKDISPVQRFNFSSGRYHLDSIESNSTTDVAQSGEYITLKVQLSFRRIVASYICHYFLPTTILVMITWLSFWLQPDMVTPRILLGLVSLITVYHLQTGIVLDSMTSPFGTALGVWGQLCSMFIVMAILETVVVNFWNRRDSEIIFKSGKDFDDFGSRSPSVTPLLASGMSAVKRPNTMPATRGNRTDALCRFGFPTIFIIFSAAYWAVCLC